MDTGVVTVSVTPVNDAPVFTVGTTVMTIPEDSGSLSSLAVATDVSDIEGDALSVMLAGASSVPDDLFATLPDVTLSGAVGAQSVVLSSGRLSANATGIWTATVLLSDAEDAEGATTVEVGVVTVSVTPVNDAPAFTVGTTVMTVPEDSDSLSSLTVATGVSDIEGNALSVTLAGASSVPDDLFATLPDVALSGAAGAQSIVLSGGRLYANANGEWTATVRLSDGVAVVDVGVVMVSVTPVNDAPAFTVGTTVMTIPEDSGSLSSLAVATGVSNIEGNALSVTLADASSVPDDLFATLPGVVLSGAVDAQSIVLSGGRLSANATGIWTATVRLSDGVAVVDVGVVTVSVTPVNDAPAFTVGTTVMTVPEDSGSLSSVIVATGVSDIDGDALSVTLADASSVPDDLFATLPDVALSGAVGVQSIVLSGGRLYADANGEWTAMVRLSDGVATVDTGMITVSVTPANDAPATARSSDDCTQDTSTPCTISIGESVTGQISHKNDEDMWRLDFGNATTPMLIVVHVTGDDLAKTVELYKESYYFGITHLINLNFGEPYFPRFVSPDRLPVYVYRFVSTYRLPYYLRSFSLVHKNINPDEVTYHIEIEEINDKYTANYVNPGKYYIKIDGINDRWTQNHDIGDYTLHLEVMPAVKDDCTFDCGTISVGGSVTGNIFPGDVDTWHLDLGDLSDNGPLLITFYTTGGVATREQLVRGAPRLWTDFFYGEGFINTRHRSGGINNGFRTVRKVMDSKDYQENKDDYLIQVRGDLSIEDVDEYTLHLEASPAPEDDCGSISACTISIGETVTGFIGSHPDIDTWALDFGNITTSIPITISITGEDIGKDLWLERKYHAYSTLLAYHSDSWRIFSDPETESDNRTFIITAYPSTYSYRLVLDNYYSSLRGINAHGFYTIHLGVTPTFLAASTPMVVSVDETDDEVTIPPFTVATEVNDIYYSTLTVMLAEGNPVPDDLFATLPDVTLSGAEGAQSIVLSGGVANANANGVWTATVLLSNDAVTLDVGVVTVSVIPVNDAPAFTMGTTVAEMTENRGPVPSLTIATDVSDIDGDTLSVMLDGVHGTEALFSHPPTVALAGFTGFQSIVLSGGLLSADANGEWTATVRLSDGVTTVEAGVVTLSALHCTGGIDTPCVLTVGASMTGSIDPRSDHDWWRLDFGEETVSINVTVHTTGHFNTYGELKIKGVSAEIETKESDDDGGDGRNFSIVREYADPNKNTYYINVKSAFGWRTGTYTLHLETSPAVGTPQTYVLANTVATIPEDSDSLSSLTVATDVSHKNSIPLSVTLAGVSSVPDGLFATLPDVALSGVVGAQSIVLSGGSLYADANGEWTATVLLSDAEDAAPVEVGLVTVSVTPVNDAPVFTVGTTVMTIPEDSGSLSSLAVATGVSDIEGGALSVTLADASSLPDDLFATLPGVTLSGAVGVQSIVLSGGRLYADANGVWTATVLLSDAEGAEGATPVEVGVVTVSVTPVNDAPAFTVGTTVMTISEDSGSLSSVIVATGVSDIDGDALSVTLADASSVPDDLFATLPDVALSGAVGAAKHRAERRAFVCGCERRMDGNGAVIGWCGGL